MKVFLSYCREDEAIAHLLAHILKNAGIRCLIDRQLRAAHPFDTGLREMITDCDLVVILLTQASLNSAWVNQEIGFAAAHKKKIWPLAMEREIVPEGFIATIGTYSLFDWSDPDQSIQRLVKTLKLEVGEPGTPFEMFGADRVLTDKVIRTKFIASSLHALASETSCDIALYNQAAFSIFAFSNTREYAEATSHSKEYMAALLEERRAMESLLQKPNLRYKLVLWPVRAYEPRLLHARFQNLIHWLDTSLRMDNVEVKYGQYSGGNRFIVPNQFVLQGYKLAHTSGYEMSLVRYHSDFVATAAQEFEDNWRRLQGNKESTLQNVRKRYEEIRRDDGTGGTQEGG